MGVRKLFFPEKGKIFQGGPGGWGKTYYIFAYKHLKDTFLLKKSRKTYYFGRPGEGEEHPLTIPCGRQLM